MQQQWPHVEQTQLQNSQVTLKPGAKRKKKTGVFPSPETACGEPEGVDGDGGKALLFGSEG